MASRTAKHAISQRASRRSLSQATRAFPPEPFPIVTTSSPQGLASLGSPISCPTCPCGQGFGMYGVPTNGTLDPGVDDQPFTPNVSILPNQTTTGSISLTNPWAGYAPTNFTSPFPPFATPSWDPPKNASVPASVLLWQLRPQFHVGKNESWNLSVERQVGQSMMAKVAYIGNHTYDLAIIQDLNPGEFVCAPLVRTAQQLNTRLTEPGRFPTYRICLTPNPLRFPTTMRWSSPSTRSFPVAYCFPSITLGRRRSMSSPTVILTAMPASLIRTIFATTTASRT